MLRSTVFLVDLVETAGSASDPTRLILPFVLKLFLDLRSSANQYLSIFLSQQIIIALILVDLIVESTIDTIQSVVFESIDSPVLRSLEARSHCLSPLISDSIFSYHLFLSSYLFINSSPRQSTQKRRSFMRFKVIISKITR